MSKRDKTLNVPVLQICSDLLSYNIFPTDNKAHGSIRFLKFFGPGIVCGSPVVFGIAGYLYESLNRKLWPEQLNTMVPVVQLITGLSVIVINFKNWKNKKISIERMDRYEFGEPENCRKLCQWFELKIMRFLHVVKVVCCLYIAYHFFNNSYCTNTGLKGDPGYVCGTAIPLWFPFKADYFFVKLLMNCCQLVITVKYMPIFAIASMMVVIEASLMICRLQDFRNVIQADKNNHSISRKLLRSYILRHYEIMDCIDKMNAFIGYGLFPIYVFLPLLLAIFIYQIFSNQDLMASIALLLWQSALVSLCYLGERLNYELFWFQTMTVNRSEPSKTTFLPKTLDLMIYNNICPRDKKVLDKKTILKFFYPFFIIGFPLIIGVIGYLYISTRRNMWPEPLVSLMKIIHILMVIQILVISQANWKNILENFEKMGRYEFGEPNGCSRTSEKFDVYITRVHYSIKALCCFFGLFHLINNSYCKDSELSSDTGYVCGIEVPLWYPCNMDGLWIKLLLSICMTIVVSTYMPVFSLITLSTAVSSILIIIRIKELNKIIVTDNFNGNVKKHNLLGYMKRHSEIIDCLNTLNESIGYNWLPIYIFMPVLFALFIYQIFMTMELITLFAFIIWFTSISLNCFLGEYLKQEQNSLCEAIYDLPWYDCDPKFNKTFHIFLGKLQLPLQIKVRPFTEMNFIYMFQALKGTYSFLVYLKQGRDRKQQ